MFLKTFYEKRRKQPTFLTLFYIFHKYSIKTFLKEYINKCPTFRTIGIEPTFIRQEGVLHQLH